MTSPKGLNSRNYKYNTMTTKEVSDQAAITTETCPVCGGTNLQPVFDYQVVGLKRCRDCLNTAVPIYTKTKEIKNMTTEKEIEAAITEYAKQVLYGNVKAIRVNSIDDRYVVDLSIATSRIISINHLSELNVLAIQYNKSTDAYDLDIVVPKDIKKYLGELNFTIKCYRDINSPDASSHNVKDICEKDNELQKNGKHNTKEMRRVHKAYAMAINENEMLEKLIKKYGGA